ncbi:FixH family protein [Massilia glaciei]|uniref:Auxin-binding protein n=1 Tax=Massilia glaciei TaxID=1524097 RepID=A0A2U2I633_9BURK|nr:FixH family protein [Massilia glaciei]PWF55228.1 Auxin-binding protein [Massilia glaciei]
MKKTILALCATLLLASISACSMPAPSNLDLRLQQPSAKSLYAVSMRSLAAPIGVNQMHSWEIRVTTPAGAPVKQARIRFDGGMPQHGHGFPTSPKVTRELGDGRYLLEGMKFSMTGWWEMKLQIDAAPGRDEVKFNTVIALPGAKP